MALAVVQVAVATVPLALFVFIVRLDVWRRRLNLINLQYECAQYYQEKIKTDKSKKHRQGKKK
jgi:hypothetical protein